MYLEYLTFFSGYGNTVVWLADLINNAIKADMIWKWQVQLSEALRVHTGLIISQIDLFYEQWCNQVLVIQVRKVISPAKSANCTISKTCKTICTLV